LVTLANVAAAWDLDQYTIRDIGSLPNGIGTYANGINRAGHVVGATYRVYDDGTIDAPSPAYFHRGKIDNIGGFGSAEAINDENHIVGFLDYSLASSDFHAFLYEHGHTHDLGALPGDQDSLAYAINNDNIVVGYSANEHVHAFVYDFVMRPLGTLPGDTDSIAVAINNKGQIVGESYKNVQSGTSEYSPSHAFLYERGQMHDIGSPPHTNVSSASGINKAGHIVGSASYETLTESGPTHAFFYDGTMHDLGTLGGLQSYSAAINEADVIVGSSDISGDSLYPSAAFVYREGRMYDLNDLIHRSKTKWMQLEQANAINDKGQITGWGFNDNGLRSFILTPVGVAFEELADQLREISLIPAAIHHIEMAESLNKTHDVQGACSMIAETITDLQGGAILMARQMELVADAAALSVAIGCE
jgi:probable HAF family extracellular repeat protein